MVIKERGLLLGVYGFLFIPIVIFFTGFLKLWVGIPLSLLLGFVFYQLWKKTDTPGEIHITKGELIGGVFIVLVWVWLSGIGGFAFQNYDHNGRNAILRDLVNHSWPVYYSNISGAQSIAGQQSLYALLYYIGYWLPSALVGKTFGLNAAFIMLYLWTVLGILFVAMLLKKKLQVSLFFILLIFIFFSGMDAVGALISSTIIPGRYPGLWPPITHLEWWFGNFQISSFTTQLFWVYNQAIPAWICVALYLAFPNPRRLVLYWSVCFFYAPLPALGFFPFIAWEIVKQSFHFEKLRVGEEQKKQKTRVHFDWKSVFTIENVLGGGMVFLTSYLYFSPNRTPSTFEMTSLTVASFAIYAIFLLLEGILVWSLFAKEMHRDPIWYLVGGSLIFWTLFFVMDVYGQGKRLTIPALFILMTWCIAWLLKKKWGPRPILIGCLVIGALTPLYEINRSVYRTAQYWLSPTSISQSAQLSAQEVKENLVPPESDHPGTLLADGWGSVANLPYDDLKSYVADIQGTFLQKYLFRSP